MGAGLPPGLLKLKGTLQVKHPSPPTIVRGLAREPAGHEVPMVRGRGVGGRALEEEEMAGRGAGTAPERIDY